MNESSPELTSEDPTPSGELSQCLTTLKAAFGKNIAAANLNQAAWRLSQAGFSKDHRKNFLQRLKTLDDPEALFLKKMAQRGFAVEQIIVFVEAPAVSTSFADRTRSQIMKEVQAEWEALPLSKRLEKTVATKNKPVGAMVALAGITAGSLILAYGRAAQSADVKQVATVVSGAFTGMAMKVVEAVTQIGAVDNAPIAALTAGSTLALAKMGKTIIEKRQAAEKARKVSLTPNLKDSVAPNTLASLFSGHKETQAKLEQIPVAHRNLLSHLSGDEIRIFLHGNDDLRAEILTARPPSYEQRLACTYALDKHLFFRWRDEQILVGTNWDDAASKIPATLHKGIIAMRGEIASPANPPPRTPVLAGPR